VSARDLLLAAARRLVAEQGRLPSLDQLARETGLSKGGVTHHLPTRAALVHALIMAVVDETDRALEAAARDGQVVATWLALSSATVVGGTSITALARVALDAREQLGDMADAIAAAAERWEGLLAAELGSAEKARIVRLVGDGLLLGQLIDDRAPALSLEELMTVVGGRP
jgi:AcrR family transcriptional regulator